MKEKSNQKPLYTNVFFGAKWIAARHETADILLFRRKFETKHPEKARLFICGLGFFRAFLNGKALDERHINPAFTDYRKRKTRPPLTKGKFGKTGHFAYYHVYDLTDFLLNGENVLDVEVAGGYFHMTDRSDVPGWDFGECRLKFVMELIDSQQVRRVVSDSRCLVSATGNRSTLYRGDFVDYRHRDLCFEQAKVLRQRINLKPAVLQGDIVGETFAPRLLSYRDNRRIYDFGQNHAGGIRCFLKGRKGQIVTARYAEILDQNGELNCETSAYEEEISPGHIRKFEQCNRYVLSGDRDSVQPLFSWRCYRYVELSSDEPFSVENLESCFIHADISRIGDFSCSNEEFCGIYQKYLYTQLSNFRAGVPTDCPHREKMPYTGDGYLTSEAVLYSFDALAFYRKWLDDILVSQYRNGKIPNTAPNMGCGGGYFWGYAVVVLPMLLYRRTGDKSFLSESYSAMRKWVRYLNGRHRGNFILTENKERWLLSDWLAPEPIRIDCAYFSTVCFFLSAKGANDAHEILYGSRDAELELLCKKIRCAVNTKFFDSKRLCYAGKEQGQTVLALYAGLPEAEWIPILQREVRRYYGEERKGHFDTGIIMTPILLEYLTNNGMADLAFTLMTRTDYPSYSYMLRNETTFPEHWSKKWIPFEKREGGELTEGGGELSHCHPMFGSVVRWLFKHVAGLDLSEKYRGCVRISPMFVEDISWSKAATGDASVEYDTRGGFLMRIQIPQNCEGDLEIPRLEGKFRIFGDKTEFVWNANGALKGILPSGRWQIEKIS